MRQHQFGSREAYVPGEHRNSRIAAGHQDAIAELFVRVEDLHLRFAVR